MEYLNWNSLMLPLMTGIGAFGFGDLKAPKVFQDLGKNLWFQWFLVFILLMQGGAGQNPQLAVVATAIVFVIVQVLDMMYQPMEGYY